MTVPIFCATMQSRAASKVARKLPVVDFRNCFKASRQLWASASRSLWLVLSTSLSFARTAIQERAAMQQRGAIRCLGLERRQRVPQAFELSREQFIADVQNVPAHAPHAAPRKSAQRRQGSPQPRAIQEHQQLPQLCPCGLTVGTRPRGSELKQTSDSPKKRRSHNISLPDCESARFLDSSGVLDTDSTIPTKPVARITPNFTM